MVMRLRWQRVADDGDAWQAHGVAGMIYHVRRNGERGYSAALQRPQGQAPAAPPIEPLGSASTSAQARWLCERHHAQNGFLAEGGTRNF